MVGWGTHLDSTTFCIQRSGWLKLGGKKRSSSQFQLCFTSRPQPLSLHSASPFPAWEQPLRALCPEACFQPQGKLTFPVLSLMQNVLLLPAPPEQQMCHLSEGQLQYRSLQMPGDKNSWTCSEHHQCPVPVSTSVTVYPQMPEGDAEKPRTGCCGISFLKSWNMEFYIFGNRFFLCNITGELGCSNILGQWIP